MQSFMSCTYGPICNSIIYWHLRWACRRHPTRIASWLCLTRVNLWYFTSGLSMMVHSLICWKVGVMTYNTLCNLHIVYLTLFLFLLLFAQGEVGWYQLDVSNNKWWKEVLLWYQEQGNSVCILLCCMNPEQIVVPMLVEHALLNSILLS